MIFVYLESFSRKRSLITGKMSKVLFEIIAKFQDIGVKDEEIVRLKAEYKLSMEEYMAASSERY